MKTIYPFLLLLFASSILRGQAEEKPVVQFSGFVMDRDSMKGISFAHIGRKGTHLAGEAKADGFFSFAVNEGDTLIFTSVGFHPYTYIVPSGNENFKISAVITMSKEAYSLPSIPIYRWKTQGDFRDSFLHAKIPNDGHAIAKANTDNQLLTAISNNLALDGKEMTDRELRYLATQHALYGQKFAPWGIFSPLAWVEFIKAIKRGDFKDKPVPDLPAADK
jgi:hypothetical protein